MEKKICVIDDSQYLMVNEYFDRMQESGYQKYTEIGSHFRDVIHSVNNELPDDVIVYFLHHTDQDASSGRTKAKTIGRLLDDKLTLEGCFDIVLRTCVTDGQYTFRTRTDGSDTAKSPEEMFETPTIRTASLKALSRQGRPASRASGTTSMPASSRATPR